MTDVTLPRGAPFEQIYCPVCVAVIHGPEDSPSCPHVLYSFISEVGSFDHLSPSIAALIEEVDVEVEDALEHPVKLLQSKLKRESVLHLEIHTSGMACGPVYSTLSLGIDFCPEEAAF